MSICVNYANAPKKPGRRVCLIVSRPFRMYRDGRDLDKYVIVEINTSDRCFREIAAVSTNDNGVLFIIQPK